MGEVKLTAQQQAATENRGGALLVSAAAGSGAAAGKRSGAGCSNGIMIRPRGKVWYTKIEEYNISALDIENLHSCGVYYVADLYTKDFESEPGWLAIRDLFAAIVAAA